MNYYEKKELINEKIRLTKILKDYRNENDWHCLACELTVKRILRINELIN